MVNSFRKSFDTEEGQAIIIGALMMLILAFGLMVTLNIGTAVQEKIRLQNGSDAAAYSLAVTEAQAFNYIAFTNRVQAAQYNMIMTIQTYQATLLLIESVLGTIYDLFATLYGLLFWVPWGIGELLYGIAEVIGIVMLIIKYLLYGNTNDEPSDFGLIPFMGYTKQAIWYINYAHYIADLIVAGVVWLKILDNMSQFARQNDNRLDAGYGIGKIVNLVLNGWEYFSTFDKYAGGVPPFPAAVFDDDKIIKKKTKDENEEYENPFTRGDHARFRQKIMGDISNASRSTQFNLDKFEDHSIFDLGILSLNFRLMGASKMIGVSPRIMNDEGHVKSFYNMMAADGSKETFARGVLPEIRRDVNEEGRSAGSWGDIPAADKGYQFEFKLSLGSLPLIGELGFDKKWGQGTYIWSDNNGGNYWRWATPDTNNTGICWMFDNDECMGNQRSDFTPTELYIRVPISPWDFFPGFMQKLIILAREGWLPPSKNGCDIGTPGPDKKDWDEDTWGPYTGYKLFDCPDLHPSACDWSGWGCCKGLPSFICKYVEGPLRRRLNTHESVHHDTNAQQYFYGISPYVKFLPKSERLKDFNQPSTWMILNLPSKHFLEGKPWNFAQKNDILGTEGGKGSHGSGYNEHQQHASITDDFKDQPGLATNPVMDDDGTKYSDFEMFNVLSPGINVMSRAQVYYHRPGNWNEHPNFFNPYWRAQLAPIAPKITSLLGQVLDLDDETENQAGGGFFSGLGNIKTMLGELFTSVLSKVITH